MREEFYGSIQENNGERKACYTQAQMADACCGGGVLDCHFLCGQRTRFGECVGCHTAAADLLRRAGSEGLLDLL